MTSKLTGILTDVFPVETTPKFSKKVFWLKQPDTERYPQHWELELHTPDIDRLKGIKVGDRLECEVEIRGRKFKRRAQGLQDEKHISLTWADAQTEEDRQRPDVNLPMAQIQANAFAELYDRLPLSGTIELLTDMIKQSTLTGQTVDPSVVEFLTKLPTRSE